MTRPGRTTGSHHRSTLSLLTIAAVLLVTACAGDPASQLIGRWTGACSDSPSFQYTGGTATIEFFEDGRMTNSRITLYNDGRFQVEGDRLTLTVVSPHGEASLWDGGYAVTDTSLELTAFGPQQVSNAQPYWCRLSREP